MEKVHIFLWKYNPNGYLSVSMTQQSFTATLDSLGIKFNNIYLIYHSLLSLHINN
jgi:hypothetical protein